MLSLERFELLWKKREESRNLKSNPSLCDISSDTNDLCDYVNGRCDYVEVESVCDEKCNQENDKEFENFVFSDNKSKSVGLKITKNMGYEGRGLGKNEQGMKELIEAI